MEWPIEQWLYKNWREQLWGQIKGPKALETGVGTGKNIPYYPDDFELTGIDLSSGMLKRAKRVSSKQQNDHITLREMDAQQMEFPDDTYDAVVATFVFCSVPCPVIGLQEALRVTKPGGKLYLLEHMLSKNETVAFIMKRFDRPIHYLTGVHIACETVLNVEKAGWNLLYATDLMLSGTFRMIEAKKPF